MNYSRQRESIKDFLSTRKDHPTADTIYMNIRKQFPNISLGTIYRNLNLLSDIGEITRLTTGDGCDHYDFNTVPHNHFVCTRCHSVLDLEMDSIDDIVEVARKNFPGRIDRHCTYFYGICAECMDTSEEASWQSKLFVKSKNKNNYWFYLTEARRCDNLKSVNNTDFKTKQNKI